VYANFYYRPRVTAKNVFDYILKRPGVRRARITGMDSRLRDDANDRQLYGESPSRSVLAFSR
jgi:hypothetical protein